MKSGTSITRLKLENLLYRGTGGRSQENRDFGFRPAFLDFATQRIYPSRYPNGMPARIHIVDGLPDEVVVERSPSGRVLKTKPSVIAGFERNGYFYTRSAAAKASKEWR